MMNVDIAKMGFSPFLWVVFIALVALAYEEEPDGGNNKFNLDDRFAGQDTTSDAAGDSIQTLPGFEVQLIYKVPREEQGSWVSLSTDPDGFLIASDQEEAGMYRIKVGGDPENPDVDVEEMIMPVSGAQGLVKAFDHFYANINGKGLFRMKDTKDDGQFDILEYLGGPKGRGEHGNHAVVSTAEKEGLYVINGNHTPPPPELAANRLSGWEEDILLSRQWDARGHAKGIMAPGGTISRINPDASEWEMISVGYRNTYDVALNREGEIFAFDSDMEWDMGMPWYRPTRLLHSVSGSDYGWRSGSGKWKAYYEDSLPAILNVGPGSPTGVLFGTGAKFPARYQRALYGIDWTFGTIYAFHLTPEGASYSAESEEFLSGNSMPMTDAVIGKDGAMYFLTGGRNNESNLYRVVYQGDVSTALAEPIDTPEAREARKQRHKLEAFHGIQDSEAVEIAWPYLNHEDRFLRHAARVAIEAQPVEEWADKALSEERAQAFITSMVALARTGNGDYRQKATEALMNLGLETLSADQKLGYLRAMALVFMRLGDPLDQEREQIAEALLDQLPDNDDRVNIELVRVLVYLKDERVIDKALALMNREEIPENPDWGGLLDRNEDYGSTIQDMIDNPPPINKLEYAFMLRNLQKGWTTEQRREYFTFINNSADAMGGASYWGFLERVRDEALANATEEEQEAVADLTAESLHKPPSFEITSPEGPGQEWTVKDAIKTVEGSLENRDFENGRNAFFATSCSACHQIAGLGGAIGPDLGSVGSNASVMKLLEDIITPSEVISSQYNSSEVTLKNGNIVSGLVVEDEDFIKIYSRNTDDGARIIPNEQVESINPVEVSQMPPGLINSLNEEELRDLIAFLKAGGDPENKLFNQSEQRASK